MFFLGQLGVFWCVDLIRVGHRRNFFAGFAEKVGQAPEGRGFAQRGQPSSDDFDFDSDEGWSAVDARGRPLAGQSKAAAFHKGAKGSDAEGRRPLGLDMVPPIAAFAGFQSRRGLDLSQMLL